MKEWCLKHPLLTFLIIDEVVTAVQNIFMDRPHLSMSKKALCDIRDKVEELTNKESEKPEDNKRPIGFAV